MNVEHTLVDKVVEYVMRNDRVNALLNSSSVNDKCISSGLEVKIFLRTRIRFHCTAAEQKLNNGSIEKWQQFTQ